MTNASESLADAEPRGEHRLRVAFVVGKFPVVSEVFIINQVADLMDRSVDVQIFAFERGNSDQVSERYAKYGMAHRTHYLEPPRSKIRRVLGIGSCVARLLRRHPRALIGAGNFLQHGKTALSLRLLYATAPFADRVFDVVHCHFGDTAVQYLTIRRLLGSTTPVVTSFYGYDVSSLFRNRPATFYDELKSVGALFYVMSDNMRQRVTAQGFPSDRIKVNPVSIDVAAYPFSERAAPPPGEPVQLLAVGRLVEKKGFDDLLEALALVRDRSTRAFLCSIVGDGPLAGELKRRCHALQLESTVKFLGTRRLQEIVTLMQKTHLLVAPSKTASYGDME